MKKKISLVMLTFLGVLAVYIYFSNYFLIEKLHDRLMKENPQISEIDSINSIGR